MKRLLLSVTILISLSCSHKPTEPVPELSTQNTAVCILTFDDGYASVYYLAKPLMDSLGFKGNCFVICGQVCPDEPNSKGPTDSVRWGDKPCDKMTWHQIESLHTDGWNIYNHGWNHLIFPDSSDINSCYSCLKEEGFNANVFAYPAGLYDEKTVNLVKLNHIAGRTTDPGLEDNLNSYVLRGYYVKTQTPLDTVKSWIDLAITQRKLLILIFHGFCTKTNKETKNILNLQSFKYILQYLSENQNLIKVETFQ